MNNGMIGPEGSPRTWRRCLFLGVILVAGCAAQPPSDLREMRVGDNIRIFDMFDNERDWGSSYLVGPPMHHFGDESRIDDTRSLPPLEAGPADPSVPPTSSTAKPTLATKPLPPVP
jgi:hypothetical protein